METVILEDNKEYIIKDKIIIDDIEYVYLVNEDEKYSFCIRKIVDDGENIAGLDTEEEWNKALNAYYKKYQDVA